MLVACYERLSVNSEHILQWVPQEKQDVNHPEEQSSITVMAQTWL